MLHQSNKLRILITGGSGFLGWHLAKKLCLVHSVAVSYSSHCINIPHCQTYWLNLTQPDSIHKVIEDFQPEVVVHTAALTSINDCERMRDKAAAINVTGTESLINALPCKEIPFIHLSTDMVFDGEQAPYNEKSTPAPINYYGASKLQAEQVIQQHDINSVILRMALIYGKPTVTGKGSFLQWMDDSLKQEESINLFEDEIRTPVYVNDVVEAIRHLVEHPTLSKLYTLGGPERLSRLDMGEQLAALRQYPVELIKPTKLSDMDLGVFRPKDLSLDSTRITKAFALKLTTFKQALQEIFSA